MGIQEETGGRSYSLKKTAPFLLFNIVIVASLLVYFFSTSHVTRRLSLGRIFGNVGDSGRLRQGHCRVRGKTLTPLPSKRPVRQSGQERTG